MVSVVLMGVLMACASGQRVGGRWELLGRRDVDFHVDHDAIDVGRAEGRFRALRFVVHGGAIEIFDVKVVLADGEAFRPATRLVFERGEARTIDMPGNRRAVRRVEFVYRSLRGEGRRANVTLYGLY
jgi:hypothetical protein